MIQILTALALDFDIKPIKSIRVRATDKEGLTVEEVLNQVLDGPDTPVAITIDNNSVGENLKKNTLVGLLAALDPDTNERHTFKLIDHPDGTPTDNSLFKISGSKLSTNSILDFENQQEHIVHIQATDRDRLILSHKV